MNIKGRDIIYGLYDDETDLLSAVKVANEKHLNILDVFSPFPVHGLDPLLGLKESRLHVAGFIFGAFGALLAFLFMTWTLNFDWNIVYGGKPYWPVPSYIPITFEVTVLSASVGMVVTFYTICGMGPGVKNPILDKRITDDKFCIAFDAAGYDEDGQSGLENFLRDTGASTINRKIAE
jgi:hypothetical protein